MKAHVKVDIPEHIIVERAQTQKDVNRIVLSYILSRLPPENKISVLDLPCGNMEFLGYIKKLYTDSELCGADIMRPQELLEGVDFIKTDLTKELHIPNDRRFDLITSISGVMMFSNTLGFIENCTRRLNENGTIIITNDNSSTIIDRLAFFFLGRYRMFKAVFKDDEPVTQNVPIQELCRLLRTRDIDVKEIVYTSFYLKDLIYLPLAIFVYPFQWLSLKRLKTALPKHFEFKMHPFKHLFYKHYIIIGTKKQNLVH